MPANMLLPYLTGTGVGLPTANAFEKTTGQLGNITSLVELLKELRNDRLDRQEKWANQLALFGGFTEGAGLESAGKTGIFGSPISLINDPSKGLRASGIGEILANRGRGNPFARAFQVPRSEQTLDWILRLMTGRYFQDLWGGGSAVPSARRG